MPKKKTDSATAPEDGPDIATGKPSVGSPPEGLSSAQPGNPSGAVRDLGGEAPPILPAAPVAGAGRAGPAPLRDGWTLTVKLVPDCITDVAAPFAVIGQYKLTPPTGAVLRFDKALGYWIRQALEMGIISSDLGQLFFVPRPVQTAGNFPSKALVLAGMGEAGRFNRDSLRYLMNNAAFAILALGENDFCATLIGSGSGGLPKHRAYRAIIDGVTDAFERLATSQPRNLTLALVESDPTQFKLLTEACLDFQKQKATTWLRLEIGEPKPAPTPSGLPCDEKFQPPDSAYPVEPTTRITVTRALVAYPQSLESAAEDGRSAACLGTGPSANTPGLATEEQVFQYSAIGETAVLPVRDVVVQSYFLDQLMERIKSERERVRQEKYGKLLACYLLPEDFRQVIDSGDSLTLVVDGTTALYPWEMAGLKGHRSTILLGPELKLTRQFRTHRADSPGIPPPVNEGLRVLIIADPAPAPYGLSGARAEGLEIIKVMSRVKAFYQDRVRLSVDLRIGPQGAEARPEFNPVLSAITSCQNVIQSFSTCDPLEILALLLEEHYDVVHFAGHGVFDPAHRREGWFFNDRCILSATEIFKIPQVPRLIFANACHSAQVNEPRPALLNEIDQRIEPHEQQVSLAEAFFAKGIQNYIGTGWPVDDEPARRLARSFYIQVLGLELIQGDLEEVGEAPPATLGAALADARQELLDLGDGLNCGTTWGAFHHYGQVNAKLLDFPNRPERDGPKTS